VRARPSEERTMLWPTVMETDATSDQRKLPRPEPPVPAASTDAPAEAAVTAAPEEGAEPEAW
jgi:hypothetical protein